MNFLAEQSSFRMGSPNLVQSTPASLLMINELRIKYT